MPVTPRAADLVLLSLAGAGYVVAWCAYCGALRVGRPSVGRWPAALTLGAFTLHASSLAARTYASGHLPIYTGYEFAVALAAGIVLVQLLFERRGARPGLGLLTLPVAMGLIAYAWTQPRAPEPVIAIFRSPWLKVHVLTAFVAYASFAATFAASCLQLVGERSGTPPGVLSGATLRRVDAVAYRAVTLGFSFLTLCIISGAIWAEAVWGRFWSWDPKETWSLITWLTYAVYLHSRHQRGWRGRRAAVLGVVGFLLVLITYLGVDFLIPRQHDFRPVDNAGLELDGMGVRICRAAMARKG